ncbi:hypothetical protein Cgig2_011934 [Carnegiea gigantea]|uniref:Reverse transcriptase zinc-binding domain-containing protein n=1 Tax=Carnegiea gigantea TaxID=171969 RepID=A0A9Q1JLL0_9CARY|nr:hypothetical protein Cgig2_011934 [Carnegiea gigantea]
MNYLYDYEFFLVKLRRKSIYSLGQCQQPSTRGGFGIRELTKWNQALHATSMVNSYRSSMTHSSNLSRSQCIMGRWGLVRAAPKFKEGLIWQIWNGCTVRVLEDKWCSSARLFLQSSVILATWEHHLIADLFNGTKTGWDISKVRSLFPYQVVWNILAQSIRLPKNLTNYTGRCATMESMLLI